MMTYHILALCSVVVFGAAVDVIAQVKRVQAREEYARM
jgi:hypothetical protein